MLLDAGCTLLTSAKWVRSVSVRFTALYNRRRLWVAFGGEESVMYRTVERFDAVMYDVVHLFLRNIQFELKPKIRSKLKKIVHVISLLNVTHSGAC